MLVSKRRQVGIRVSIEELDGKKATELDGVTKAEYEECTIKLQLLDYEIYYDIKSKKEE